MPTSHSGATRSFDRTPAHESTASERMRDAAVARICAAAHERRATVLAIRMAEHADPDIAWDLEIATTADHAKLPVLVVPQGASSVATQLLLATDFSETSLSAARAALALAPLAHIHLVHVCPKGWCCTPKSACCSSQAQVDDPFGALFDALFDACAATLQVPSARITRVVLTGDPAETLVQYALDQGIDLIALGIHGHTSVHGKELGAVAAHVLRGATCRVVVSGPSIPEEYHMVAPAINRVLV